MRRGHAIGLPGVAFLHPGHESRRIHRPADEVALSLFALDNFGSSMSSFAYLKQLPVDFLKIDGSFIRTLVEDRLTRAMAEAINRVAHVMAIETVAECTETAPILALLQELGVDHAQGYALARPLPEADALVPSADGAMRHSTRDPFPSSSVTNQAFSPVASNSPPHGSTLGATCSSPLAQRVAEGRKIAERSFRLRTGKPSNSARTSPALCQRAPR